MYQTQTVMAVSYGIPEHDEAQELTVQVLHQRDGGAMVYIDRVGDDGTTPAVVHLALTAGELRELRRMIGSSR